MRSSVTNATRPAPAPVLHSGRRRDLLPLRIATARLVLRPPIRGDVPDLVRLGDNPRVAERLFRLPAPYTRADAIGFVEIVAQRADEKPYAITRDDRFIGIVGFSYPDPAGPAELGYWLGEPHWGRGIMSEAVAGLIDAAFATGAYPAIRARAYADNFASIRVLAKAGFKKVASAADGGRKHGQRTVVLELEQPRWM